MRVPDYLRRRLRDYDPHLRLRWSKEKKSFILERKADQRFIPRPVITKTGSDGKPMEIVAPIDSDRYIQYHQGYLPILTTSVLSEKLLHQLWQSDAWNGCVDFIKRREEKERQEEIRKERKESDDLQDISGESYDHLRWAQGERIAI